MSFRSEAMVCISNTAQSRDNSVVAAFHLHGNPAMIADRSGVVEKESVAKGYGFTGDAMVQFEDNGVGADETWQGIDTADEYGNENEEDGGKRNQRLFASRGVEQRHEAGGGKSWLS